MKTIFITIFSILSIVTFAQTESSEVKRFITEFKVEAKNIHDLKNIDWNIFKKVFQENDKDQEITLVFNYSNETDTDTDKTKGSLKDFKIKCTGKTYELASLIEESKSQIKNMLEIKEKFQL